jgi:hypothetical protein
MKLVKSLLLGSAAGLTAVAGAQAADLPVKKAAPVDYVRVCSVHGAGFFYIPGGDTCLRIGGRVRAEYRFINAETRFDSQSGFRARAQLFADARTATAYGTLRAFVQFRLQYQSGNYTEGGFGLVGGASVRTFSGNPSSTADVSNLNRAFVQFAGITAGRVTSFYDFYANTHRFGGLPTGSDTDGNDPVVLAYTATFGGGFSATISIEDPNVRRVAPAINLTAANVNRSSIAYGGSRVPDIVGVLRVDQAWGSAQLSGALHELRDVGLPVIQAATGVVDPGRRAQDSEYGFAVQGGVKLNLPFIAPGDQLWLQGGYTQGALSYIGIGNNFNQRTIRGINADAVAQRNGDLKKTDGYVLTATFLHYWAPQWRSAFFGTYGEIDYSRRVETPAVRGVRPADAFVDTKWFDVGGNLIWSPVRDLDIGVEVVYRVVDPKGRVADVTNGRKTTSRDEAIEARFRIQRDF